MAIRISLLAGAAAATARPAAFPHPEDPAVRLPLPHHLPLAGVLCGPERRCRQTADALGWRPVTVVPELAALAAGAWTGRSAVELASADPGFVGFLADHEYPSPGGESINALIDRVAGFLGRYQVPDGRTAIVAVPMVVRAIMVTLLELPASAFDRLDVEPPGAVELHRHNSQWRLRIPMRS